MNLDKVFSFEEAFKVADEALVATQGRHLSDVEVLVLRGSWHEQTYEEIAENTKYSANYLQRDIGAQLWKLLAEALGEPQLSKTNFRAALKRQWQKLGATPIPNLQPISSNSNPNSKPQVGVQCEISEGQGSVDTTFYVERPPIESCCYKEILQPGALIRIKAPRQMGKTLLMNRILQTAATHGYRTVRLNFRQAEGAIFSSLDRFLRWFCANVSRQLELQPKLDDYWDEQLMGSMVSCTIYFQTYLLERIGSPLVLGLDEVDWVFLYGEIARDFFALLRTWHEEVNNLPIWRQLRLVIVHSTEVYIPLKINQSPFNVGLPVELPEFSQEQVLCFAQRYGFDWSQSQVEQLMAMVGGHPYLIRLALERIRPQDVTLEQVLQTAATEAGIYNDHLRRHLGYLQQNQELAVAFKKVVTAETSVQLEPMQVYQLHSMGLVQIHGNDCTPRCNLYCQYFRNHLRAI